MTRKARVRRLIRRIEQHVNYVGNEWSNVAAAERVTLRLLPVYEALKREA